MGRPARTNINWMHWLVYQHFDSGDRSNLDKIEFLKHNFQDDAHAHQYAKV